MIPRRFSQPGSDSFDLTDWKSTDVEIVSANGKVVYSQKGVEAPVGWSQTAIDIAVNKYFRKAGLPKSISSEGRETSVRQLIERVVHHIETVAREKQYFEEDE
ncbi:MAG: Vitamin B12-dependent ribonucleotide reductase, partial [Pseudomonadota bacterium]